VKKTRGKGEKLRTGRLPYFSLSKEKSAITYMHEAFNHTKSILPEYSLPKGRKYLQEGVSEAGR